MGVCAAFRDDDIGEVGRDSGRARAFAASARRDILIHLPAGNLDVLRGQRALHVCRSQIIGAHPVRVDDDIDLPLQAAEHQHLLRRR